MMSRITFRPALNMTVTCLLLCLLIFSCARKEAIREAVLEPYTGPVTIETLKKWIGFRNVTSISSLADVRIFKDGEPAGSFNGAFGYKIPDQMRLSLFGTFGLTVMEVLISKDMLQTYFPSKNILYEWKSPNISFNALIDDRYSYSMEKEGDMFVLYAYRLENNSAELIAEYLFDRTYLFNKSIIFYSDGTELIRVDFIGFNGRIPEQTKILFRNGSTMKISLNEPEFDTDIPDTFFKHLEHGDKEVLPFRDFLEHLSSGL